MDETGTAAESAKPDIATPGTCTVKKGDTLREIALNFYGSNRYHKALYKANAAAFQKTKGKLVPGMVLTLPQTLGTIAKAVYGNAMKYKDIFNRSPKNANTIYEGQVIVLPAKSFSFSKRASRLMAGRSF